MKKSENAFKWAGLVSPSWAEEKDEQMIAEGFYGPQQQKVHSIVPFEDKLRHGGYYTFTDMKGWKLYHDKYHYCSHCGIAVEIIETNEELFDNIITITKWDPNDELKYYCSPECKNLNDIRNDYRTTERNRQLTIDELVDKLRAERRYGQAMLEARELILFFSPRSVKEIEADLEEVSRRASGSGISINKDAYYAYDGFCPLHVGDFRYPYHNPVDKRITIIAEKIWTDDFATSAILQGIELSSVDEHIILTASDVRPDEKGGDVVTPKPYWDPIMDRRNWVGYDINDYDSDLYHVTD